MVAERRRQHCLRERSRHQRLRLQPKGCGRLHMGHLVDGERRQQPDPAHERSGRRGARELLAGRISHRILRRESGLPDRGGSVDPYFRCVGDLHDARGRRVRRRAHGAPALRSDGAHRPDLRGARFLPHVLARWDQDRVHPRDHRGDARAAA